jgi:hypothetical protein
MESGFNADPEPQQNNLLSEVLKILNENSKIAPVVVPNNSYRYYLV